MPSSATSSAAERATFGSLEVETRAYGWVGRFTAMASPCEVHVSGADRATAGHLVAVAASEAWRIEQKLSRYRDANVVHAINSAGGRAVRIDHETAQLLRYAGELHELSGGRFDITSGVLRRAWKFDGSDRVPPREAVRALLDKVGWHRVRLDPPHFVMQPSMEIDFGGIGKEYAVDCAAALARQILPHCLINFGGDLLAVGPHADGSPWVVGIESVDREPARDASPLEARPIGWSSAAAETRIELTIGALATSGDARRYLLKDGIRYGHVLDPRTGWPVHDAPRSVTVAAPTCTEAGMLATFALLQGARAERFLSAQQLRHWCRR